MHRFLSIAAFLLIVGGLAIMLTAHFLHVSLLPDQSFVTRGEPIPVSAEETPNQQGKQQYSLLTSSFAGQQQNQNASMTSTGIQSAWTGGYRINVPSDFVYSNPKRNYEIWHSGNFDQLIIVEWEPYAPDSRIKRTEDATVLSDGNAGFHISHPSIRGAGSTTMIETPTYKNSPSGIYLWVVGANGQIYSLSVISETRETHASSQAMIDSFSLMA